LQQPVQDDCVSQIFLQIHSSSDLEPENCVTVTQQFWDQTIQA